jgi:cyclophilin family peptidyl-prolyl cis-trans isomerase
MRKFMTIGMLFSLGVLALAVGLVSCKDTNEHAIRNPSNKFVTLETDDGKMTLELFHDVAPAHADSFLARSKDGFYNGTIFHRVIDRFMIQGGDPTGTGTGHAEYYLKAEFSNLKHLEGTLSMARGSDPNSASCQFFICLAPAQFLDGKYTIFGQLINGYQVLHKIGSAEVENNDFGEKSKPVKPVHIIKAYQSDAKGNPL